MSNILIVHAHPESKSLTSALKDHAVSALRAQGHEVRVSDLYGSAWNAVAAGQCVSASNRTSVH
jgi:NAD(P)H dehydrogenase (quinone)